MFQRRHHRAILRRGSLSLPKVGRDNRVIYRRQFWVERLEERCMLSASPISPVLPSLQGALVQNQSGLASGAATADDLPYPEAQTFKLHSDPTATKTIYLDFVGFITRNTAINSQYHTPNIVTPAFSLDDDLLHFSDDEQLLIQTVWERVSEDFRPFDVDVTTQDPGVESLRQDTSGTDNRWGIRVVIGGSTYDWFTPETGVPKAGVSIKNSFTSSEDVPAFVFAGDFFGVAKYTADIVSNVTGASLGLDPDGQTRDYFDISDPDMTKWSWKTVTFDYYNGHPDVTPPSLEPTSWGPIMGVPYTQLLTQWSQGEYPGATNIQDDLAIITSQNGFGYRADDHGNTRGTASSLKTDTSASGTNSIVVQDEGIIERNTDVDYFSFTVDGLGEVDQFDITPFYDGPNLDILAKIVDSSGNVIATSNPNDDLPAGSDTFGASSDGGWLLTATGEYTDTLFLTAGTYYLTVEGTGRPIAFIDPVAHPGPPPITDPPTPPGPNDKKVPDASDWGYTNYGSLGYYSITGTRSKGLVVGVDFDAVDQSSPINWNQFNGSPGSNGFVTGPDGGSLISESGSAVPYGLSITSTGSSIDTVADGAPIASADIPSHAVPLDALDGYIPIQGQTLTFTWSNLEPWTFHQVYVFGHADTFDAHNIVTIVGGNLNGTVQTIPFTQVVEPCGLEVNDKPPSNDDLSTFAYKVLSDGSGQITITVTSQAGFEGGIAGLAIVSTRPIGPEMPGSISGQKWDDIDGNQMKGSSEPGMAGWMVYLDANNNGQLDMTSTPDQTLTQASPDVPQAIQDYTTVKSELDFPSTGQILDVNVALDISHTYDSDLHVTLISPSGTRVLLFANVGDSGVDFHNTVFDDSAIIPLNVGTAPFTGTFRPQQALSAFNNEDAFGAWKLEIYDDSAGDVGVLNSWSLTIKVKGVTTYLEDFRVTDASGNYAFTDLAPGLYYVREYETPQQIAAGWRPTWAPTPITVQSGIDIQGVDFGNWMPTSQKGSIVGQVFYDASQDGVNDEHAGIPGRVVYIDGNNNGVRDVNGTPTVISATDLPKPILDPPVASTTSQIIVGDMGTVFNVAVTLNVTHSFVGDLNAYLVGPSGTQVELFSGVGGQFNNFQDLTLSDDAARSISTIGFNDWNGAYSGVWQPEGQLSDFTGQAAAGIWTLVISDTTHGDEGTLNGWSLTFTSGEPFTTTDEDGFYRFDNLAADQYIIREEVAPGWTQIPPATTDIPAAMFANSAWTVNVVGIDNLSDPDGPDSHRNVRNVDFANFAPTGSIAGQVYNDADGDSMPGLGEPGLSGWTVFVDANGNGSLDLQSVDNVTFSNTAAAINSFFPVASKLWIGDLATITHINVQLDISHTYDSDLTVNLVSPAGTRVRLFSGVGGNGQNFSSTIFSDDSIAPISGGTAPFDGVYKSEQPLSTFYGESSIGFWTLEITDNSPANDTGNSLNFWGIEIIGNELSAVTDAQGNYSFGNLPPGIYAVNTDQKSGWTRTQVPGNVTVGPGQNVTDVNFGNQSAVPILPGDYNLDGFVNGADYVMFRQTMGSHVTAFSGADGDGSGVIDQADFGVWRAHFGQSSGGGAGNVMAADTGSGALVQDPGASQQASVAPLTVETIASPVVETVQPAATLEPLAAEPQGSSAAGIASLSSLESPVFVAQDLPSTRAAVSPHDELIAGSPVVSASSSDLGLLAWIASSPAVTQPAGTTFSDYDFAASPMAEEPASLDAAFETLEGSAFGAVAI